MKDNGLKIDDVTELGEDALEAVAGGEGGCIDPDG